MRRIWFPFLGLVAVLTVAGCDVPNLGSGGSGTPGESGSTPIATLNAPAGSCHYAAHFTPDIACTPGVADSRVTQDNLQSTICASGWSTSVRPPVGVTEPIKVERMKAYGNSGQSLAGYELDHLIPIEVGGASDVGNLWPQPADPTPGYHQKDALENGIHKLVCEGQLSLADGQKAFSVNWYTAYEKYCVEQTGICFAYGSGS